MKDDLIKIDAAIKYLKKCRKAIKKGVYVECHIEAEKTFNRTSNKIGQQSAWAAEEVTIEIIRQCLSKDKTKP